MGENFEKELRESMLKSEESLKNKFRELRVGRASIDMVDNVRVSSYGDSLPLNQVGTLSIPDAKTIMVEPWDKSLFKEIDKGIRKAEPNWNPINDGNSIRIILPEVTEETRKQLLKKAKKELEEAKVSLRNIRKHFNSSVRRLKESGEMAEDEMHSKEKIIQKITDEYVHRLDSLFVSKEKDILTI